MNCGYDIDKIWDGCGQYVDFGPEFAHIFSVQHIVRSAQLRYELQSDIKVQVFALQAVHPTQLC